MNSSPYNGYVPLESMKEDEDFLDIMKAMSPKDRETVTSSPVYFKKFQELVRFSGVKKRQKIAALVGATGILSLLAGYFIGNIAPRSKNKIEELTEEKPDLSLEVRQLPTQESRVVLIKDEWRPEFMFIDEDGSLTKDAWNTSGSSPFALYKGYGSVENESALIRGIADTASKPKQKSYLWKIKSMKVQSPIDEQQKSASTSTAAATPVVTSMTVTNIFGHNFILERTGTPYVWYVRYPGLVKGKKIYVVSNTTDKKLGKGYDAPLADRWRIIDY